MLKFAIAIVAVSLPASAAAGSNRNAQNQTRDLQRSENGRACHLRGVVTLAPDSSGPNYGLLYFQDSSGGILMRTTRRWSIEAGDTVEVSGLVRSPHSVTVQNVTRLDGGAKPQLELRFVSLEEALRGDGFGELITVSGPLRKVGDAILVGPGPSLKTYFRNQSKNAAVLQNLKEGSRGRSDRRPGERARRSRSKGLPARAAGVRRYRHRQFAVPFHARPNCVGLGHDRILRGADSPHPEARAPDRVAAGQGGGIGQDEIRVPGQHEP